MEMLAEARHALFCLERLNESSTALARRSQSELKKIWEAIFLVGSANLLPFQFSKTIVEQNTTSGKTTFAGTASTNTHSSKTRFDESRFRLTRSNNQKVVRFYIRNRRAGIMVPAGIQQLTLCIR